MNPKYSQYDSWYIRGKLLRLAMDKEAGWRTNFTAVLWGLALMLAHIPIEEAASKANVPVESLQDAAEDPEMLEAAEQILKEQTQETVEEATGMPSDSGIYQSISQHEGIRSRVYDDSRGIPTIGIGFNLRRKDAPRLLQNIGVDINKVLQGQQALTDDQILTLYKQDAQTAISDARQFVDNFDQLPKEAKLVVIDMAFNLGLNRLSGFEKFKAALEQQDYQEAAKEMIDSKWYHQTGNRSKNLVGIMQSIDS